MRKYKLPIKIQSVGDEGYLAICPAIQGCHAEGKTIAEAFENLEDVAKILLELRQEDQMPLPEALIIAEVSPELVLEGQLLIAAT
ncbi:MAG: type II toxin-antitoxin system HicB family antitoxin [Candidatus Poribacteria bacterium]|nr:type II toxin-antitoxin system HicB family antitoxin [Candidatus Poribacteria bacterium]